MCLYFSWFKSFSLFWMLYYFWGWFPGVWILCRDVSERSVCSIFIGGVRWNWQSVPKRRYIKLRRREVTKKNTIFIFDFWPPAILRASDWQTDVAFSNNINDFGSWIFPGCDTHSISVYWNDIVMVHRHSAILKCYFAGSWFYR